VRTATGRGFTPGGANGGRRGSVASAHAHGKRPGQVYKGAGGQLRGRGVNHIAAQQGAATCGGAAANGVRRLARRRVGTSHLAPSKRSRESPTVTLPAQRMDRWVRRCLSVRARRAYGRWRGTRARRRTWARSGVPRWKQFAEAVFNLVFL
jgi:hypothetical protein